MLSRAVTARANYLSQDRSDIRCAVKELSRNMSAPRSGDMTRLRRLGRYRATHTQIGAEAPGTAAHQVLGSRDEDLEQHPDRGGFVVG